MVCYVPSWAAGTPCQPEKRKPPTISWISLLEAGRGKSYTGLIEPIWGEKCDHRGVLAIPYQAERRKANILVLDFCFWWKGSKTKLRGLPGFDLLLKCCHSQQLSGNWSAWKPLNSVIYQHLQIISGVLEGCMRDKPKSRLPLTCCDGLLCWGMAGLLNSALQHTVYNDSHSCATLNVFYFLNREAKCVIELQEDICGDWWLLNVLLSPTNLTSHLEIIAFYTYLDTKRETHDFVSLR